MLFVISVLFLFSFSKLELLLLCSWHTIKMGFLALSCINVLHFQAWNWCFPLEIIISFLYFFYRSLQLKDDGDFLYLLADAAVTAVYFNLSIVHQVAFCNFYSLCSLSFQILHLQFQYGNPDTLCSPLINAKKSGKNLVVGLLSLQLLVSYSKMNASVPVHVLSLLSDVMIANF